ncbi:MAG: lysophospholipid acyltransferase family protein [Planctomycetota bacterium]
MVATSSKRSSTTTVALRAGRLAAVSLTVAAYTVLAPFGYAALAALCALWRRDPRRRARRLQTITSRAYRLMHWWLTRTRITSFDWRSTASQLPDGPCVVIANHPTLMDVTAITAALGGATSIVKPGLYQRAMIRPLLRGLGHVQGPGADPIRAGRVVDDVIERLAWGLPVVIFPEGTRSPPDDLMPFGRVAFEVACRAQVPLVCLAVTCEPVYLSKQVPPFRPPHPMPRLEVRVLDIWTPDESTSSRALRARTEARYTSLFQQVAEDKGET